MTTDDLHAEALRRIADLVPQARVNVLDMRHENGRHQYRLRLVGSEVAAEPCAMGYDAAQVLRDFERKVRRWASQPR